MGNIADYNAQLDDWSAEFGREFWHGVGVLFKEIEPGQPFRFSHQPATDAPHIRTGGAWYRDAAGRRWKTGMRTSVIPL